MGWRARVIRAAGTVRRAARQKAGQHVQAAGLAARAAKQALLASGMSPKEARGMKRVIKKAGKKEARSIKRVEGREEAWRIWAEAKASHNPKIAACLAQFDNYASKAPVEFDLPLALSLVDFAEDAYRIEKTLKRITSFPIKNNSTFKVHKYFNTEKLRRGYHRKKWIDTQAYLFVDKENKEVVLSFRGATGMPLLSKDWRTILHFVDMAVVLWLKPSGVREEFNQDPLFPCAVHKGFYLAYDAVRYAILDEMATLNPLHIYVTGHSLGGALATLAALDLQLEFPSAKVSMYNFGSSRVGERMFAVFYNRIVPDSHRVVLPGDPVPLMPPQPLSYHHVKQEHTLKADLEEGAFQTRKLTRVNILKRHSYGGEEELKYYRQQLFREIS